MERHASQALRAVPSPSTVLALPWKIAARALACPREGHARAIAWIRTDDPWEMTSEEGSRPRADCSPTRSSGMLGG
jgi:hypothetical protein